MSSKLKLGLISFVLFDLFLAIVFVSLYLARSERQAVAALQELGVTSYPEPLDIIPFELTDEHGNAFTAADFNGHWNFVFFGFTSCPDICPLTMAELGQFYAGLSDTEQARAQVIMVSVDPARDDNDAMARYVDSFNEDFVGLTGTHGDIADLASQFFVAHSKPVPMEHNTHSTDSPGEDYLIQHSGHLAIVDPAGKFTAVMRSPVRDQDITEAFRQFLANQ